MLTTMLSTLAHTLSEDMIEYDGRAPAPAPDPELYGINARYRLYEAADGWVFLAAPHDEEWARVTRVLGPWVDLPASASDGALIELLTATFFGRSAQAWEDELTAAGVGCVAVAPAPVEDRLMTDPGIGRDSGLITEVEHPVVGRHTRLVPPVRFSRSTTVAAPACLVGQHTDTVLKELGYADDRIAELRAAGVIG
jgi:crotonobetainyl-CoA:carnitine CoA-transferase CaiB-like acyl-CoA transferase